MVVSAHLSLSEFAALKKAAAPQGRCLSDEIRAAIASYLSAKQHEFIPKARNAHDGLRDQTGAS